MERWQEVHIEQNLPRLISMTICNIDFLTRLRACGVLAAIDVEEICGKLTTPDRANMLYNILITRKNSYNKLVQALAETNQTGSVDILLYGISTEIFSTLKIEFLDSVYTLGEILNAEQIKNIQSWIKSNLSMDDCQQFYDGSFMESSVLPLTRDGLPQQDPLYISRFLQWRVSIDTKLFRKKCTDVFVFKHAKRVDIKNLIDADSDTVQFSTGQLLNGKITARFIILDNESDWDKILEKVNSPVHLVRQDTSNSFVLEKSIAGSEGIQEFLKHDHSACGLAISEERFLHSALRNTSSGICICDAPGMGKSLLLGDLALKVQKEFPDRIVAFIPLRNILLTEHKLGDVINNRKAVILQNISYSPIASRILLEVVERLKTKFELFLDGLDELQGNELKLTIELLSEIRENLPEARMYVTSRKVLRRKLETALGVIAYDVCPFDKKTQYEFLIKFWTQKNESSDVGKLREFARFCLKSLENWQNDSSKTIAGIPLQCKLIADVYAQQAIIYAGSSNTSAVQLSEHTFLNSLSEIYEKYISRQIGATLCNFTCMRKHMDCSKDCQIISFHMWAAIKTVFPCVAEKISQYLNSFENLNGGEVLAPGILVSQKNENNCEFEFAHRTFAEFLVADYFARLLFQTPFREEELDHYKQIAQELMFNEIFTHYGLAYQHKSIESLTLREAVVAYFLDAKIGKYGDSTIINNATLPATGIDFFYVMEGCVLFNSLLNVYLNTAVAKIENDARVSHKKFLTKNRNIPIDIFSLAAQYCNVNTIKSLSKFFQAYFDVNLVEISSGSHKDIMWAVLNRYDLELVCHFVNILALKYEWERILLEFLQRSYFMPDHVVETKLDIVQLLVKSQTNWIKTHCGELKRFLSEMFRKKVHLSILHFFFKINANEWKPHELTLGDITGAGYYMSGEHFLELCCILITECNAWSLLFDHKQWKQYFRYTSSWEKYDMFTLVSLLRLSDNRNPETFFMQYCTVENACTRIATWEDMISTLKNLLRPDLFKDCEDVFIHIYYLALVNELIKVIDLYLDFDKSLIEHLFSKTSVDRLYYRSFSYLHTPLFKAVENKQIKLIEYLISRGANLFAVDTQGQTILHVSARTQDSNFFHWIAEHITKQQSNSFKSFVMSVSNYAAQLMYDLEYVNSNTPENIPELFAWQDKLGKTALHHAVEHFDVMFDTLDLIVKQEKSIFSYTQARQLGLNKVDENGDTVIFVALKHADSVNLIKDLVKCGADWNHKDSNGQNVAHFCSLKNLNDELKYFISLGVSINELDSHGNNALQCIFYNYTDTQVEALIETVNVLINAGVNKGNNWIGLTPYVMAVKQKVDSRVLDLIK